MTVQPNDERAIDVEMVAMDELQRIVVREEQSVEPADATRSDLQARRRSHQSDPSCRELLNNSFPSDHELTG